ncbi:fosmidomycin resistance protein [Cellvibrio sp. QJXJ]|uniref:fosmidomycin resistance protein n=1 Tax=Cellvibrio sp. QJXJ TaxID=2964606 RepID=UPI0021C28BAD|nr:fosmidomycin resistance protein [Cellvibrio sp. QJXJ]UUA74759.1 fosmidomycin resistance protein [Cellvibrio sp. QJXJ]
MPTKIGLMFGISGIAAAGLGALADATSIEHIFNYCAFLPMLGIITILLPAMKRD